MTPRDCIDLAALYGDRFRLSWDESRRPGESTSDPWMRTLLCRRGVIYPFGGDRLAVEVDGRREIARRLAAIPGVELWQNGDREKTLVFPLSLFDAVAALVKPKRRPRLSPEQRAARAARANRLNDVKRGASAGGVQAESASDAPEAV